MADFRNFFAVACCDLEQFRGIVVLSRLTGLQTEVPPIENMLRQNALMQRRSLYAVACFPIRRVDACAEQRLHHSVQNSTFDRLQLIVLVLQSTLQYHRSFLPVDIGGFFRIVVGPFI